MRAKRQAAPCLCAPCSYSSYHSSRRRAAAEQSSPNWFSNGGSLTQISARTEALQQGLRDLGYTEGENIEIEWRFAERKLDRLSTLAAELGRLKVDAIITGGPQATPAAKEATGTIPIIMTQDSDTVGNGFIATLARPGGKRHRTVHAYT